MTKSPSPSVDEAGHEDLPTFLLWVTESYEALARHAVFPDEIDGFNGSAEVARHHHAALVSPPKAEAGEPVAVAWQTGERELALRWIARLSAKLGSKPDHADDSLWLDRLHALLSAAPNHEARGDGVRVTEATITAGITAGIETGRKLRSIDAHKFSDEYVDMAVSQDAIRAVLALLPLLGDGRAEIVEAVRPTFDDLRAAIEQSRNRNVAGGGWSLTDKQADIALEWSAFLEGIGAPCPKIAGFDEGLHLVWPGNHRHYLILGDDAEGFVLNVDAKGHRRSLSNPGGGLS